MTMIVIIANLLLGVSFFGHFTETTIVHEQTHEAIAYNYGCIDHKTNIDVSNMGGSFKCLEYAPGYNHEEEMLMHTMNEIVSYNASSIQSAILIGTTILMNVLLIIGVIMFSIMKSISKVLPQHIPKGEQLLTTEELRLRDLQYKKYRAQRETGYKRGPYKVKKVTDETNL